MRPRDEGDERAEPPPFGVDVHTRFPARASVTGATPLIVAKSGDELAIRREVEWLPSVLIPRERPIVLAFANRRFLPGLLVLTDRRLIWLQRRVIRRGIACKFIPLKDVAGVDATDAPDRTLTFRTLSSDRRVNFTTLFDEQTVVQLADRIRKEVVRARTANAPQPDAGHEQAPQA